MSNKFLLNIPGHVFHKIIEGDNEFDALRMYFKADPDYEQETRRYKNEDIHLTKIPEELVVLETEYGLSPDTPTEVTPEGGKQSKLNLALHLLPARAILEVGRILKQGADKYDSPGDDRNWKKIPIEDHLNHALMHIFAYLLNDKQDEHLSHAACRILFALELDDSP